MLELEGRVKRDIERWLLFAIALLEQKKLEGFSYSSTGFLLFPSHHRVNMPIGADTKEKEEYISDKEAFSVFWQCHFSIIYEYICIIMLNLLLLLIILETTPSCAQNSLLIEKFYYLGNICVGSLPRSAQEALGGSPGKSRSLFSFICLSIFHCMKQNYRPKNGKLKLS